MQRSDRRLLIGSHAPGPGGVTVLVEALLGWAGCQPGLRTELAFGAPTRRDPLNATLPFSTARVERGDWGGRPATRIGQAFPPIESLRHALNRAAWSPVLAAHQFHVVVCGYAVTALPWALAGVPYAVWVASGMKGDRRTRERRASLPRRMLHFAERPLLERWERLALTRAKAVWCLSSATQREIAEVVSRQTEILSPPVALGAGHGASPDSSRIVWLGRHDDPRKNTRMLLAAFRRVRVVHPAARLDLVGGHGLDALRAEAVHLGLGDSVTLHGEVSVERKREILAQAAVFALPSDQEGLCLAALEAMAFGVPVVSTRSGGPEDFVHDGDNGLLVPVGDEAAMAAGLACLLGDPERRKAMGCAARETVRASYSPEAFAARVTQLISACWSGFAGDPAGDRGGDGAGVGGGGRS